MTATLGISAFGPDAAAALVVDGECRAAAAEERYTRVRHDPAFPRRAIRAVLAHGGLSSPQLDQVVFHEKPLRKFERVLASQLAAFPRSAGSFGRSLSTWLGDRLWLKGRLASELGVPTERVLFCGHHLSHAAAAYLPAPCEQAAVLVADGAGEWEASSLWRGQDGRLEQLAAVSFPHSLALFYSAITEYLGFPAGGGEQRTMELAAHGDASRVPRLRELLHLSDDGSYALELAPFRFAYDGTRLFGPGLEALLGPARRPGDPLRHAAPDARDADVAAAAQSLVEEALLHLVRELHRRAPCDDLCFAGELALNARAGARLLREGPFRRLWIPPAAGEDGCALGAALLADALGPGRPGRRWRQAHAFLGDTLDALDDGVGTPLDGEPAVVAALLAALQRDGLVGWVRGRFEWGPRSLGHRSLLADPRGEHARRRVDGLGKHRESFRSYSPALPAERAHEYLELPPGAEGPLRFMQLSVPAHPRLRAAAPALVAADGSCRPQLVHAAEDPALHRLLTDWGTATGLPVLLHTSLNARGEVPVRTAEDARDLWERSGLRVLVAGDRLLKRD